ncbi:FAD-dependent oxidoreductase [Mycolicibacillus parakoreensis]|uniref:NAD(P)/FAD-dependent oxidoreductase n=1 Tax=Mycolicibacillus parakoreensis TaxID=1069221 RepID=A0ABY3U279_9MYCO|nr:NAD(P)/FAD-dependent oxidoreductase [Mycolicibacillus parakoreensis]MCV7314385.1 FAD-dependent oxidoreductase [Mycolicibacillus parakoreensis]ULN53269.1 NAD(P)/FAD-dependent oxidoreductase [Mycolicibacillus parakoreensis]HLR99820.1 NAD(P)/FAD-dependent oxidoreductase [Mycolicibacillus parakoreensis]
MTSFPELLAPGRIGAMTLRNRLVMSPMETMYGTPEGLPSQRTREYFAARARGGVGLITVGATGIDPQHPETPGGLHLGTDAAVAAHRQLVEAVHEHGAKIQPQIVHAGPDGLGPELHHVTSLGPSVIPSYLTGRPSAEVTAAQLSEIFDLFRAAVRRAAEAGYDGIELHAAHGYMFLGSFLAPQRNRRTDDYTGYSPRGRIKVVTEALAAIRSEVGDALPITLRISGYERVAGGRPLYETAQVAPQLVAAGVDAFHVSGGVIDRLVTHMVNGADDGDALNVGAAAAVKQAVDVPVIAVGRIHDPARAEQILADGRADFIAMGRPLLADPDLPAKLAAGHGTRVRRCISCENCIDAMEIRFSVDCAVNPRAGRERELAIHRSATPKSVVVVGGGPAGLEAARVAAARGHSVTLFERAARLGGALLWASVLHPENAPFLDWLRAEIDRSGVRVVLNRTVSTAEVRALNPNAVVVATGAQVVAPTLPGAELGHVHTGAQLRSRFGGRGAHLVRPTLIRAATRVWLPGGRRVVIVGGDLVALELAEFLAARGRLVTIVEPGKALAPEVGDKRRTEHADRLDRYGVTVHVRAEVHRITDAGVEFTPFRGTVRTVGADSVVLAGTPHADTTVYDAIRAALPDTAVFAAGDCTGLGLIRKATEDGARAACAI